MSPAINDLPRRRPSPALPFVAPGSPRARVSRRAVRASALWAALGLGFIAVGTPGCTINQTRAAQEEPAVTVEERLVYYRLETSMGPILMELDRLSAPVSVGNFEQYAETRGYDGSVFHRVIPGFVIQGGGFNPDLSRRATNDPIVNEWQNGLSNSRGSVAMARMTGKPDSATSQFFINLADNRQLDVPGQDGAGYAVFGRVVHGMQVVDAIGRVQTRDVGRFADVPVQAVRILAVEKLTPAHAEDIINSAPDSGA